MIKPILDGKAEITKTKFARESGRVTELTAKPLLNFFFPEISFEQPLSGQFAARKEILQRINFEKDYGVDVGIVIDADVLGISIMEVDIGAIQHDMSPLEDLNLMANEVVRTIIGRANKYGRVTMIDDIGYYIRMSIVGLSLIILGLFTIFFVKIVPLFIGVLISVIGLILSVYYIIKVIVKSVDMFRKTPKGNLLKSFIKIHFPMIISVIILLLMISTFIGAAHFENGVLSIEPNSRNLIIYSDSSTDSAISVRGPYTVDTAIENESFQIRMPSAAMMTLGVKANDTIEINNGFYTVNETRDGEQDTLRLPIEVKKSLGVEDGDIIQDSRLKEIFKGSIISHSIEKDNTTLVEEFIVSSRNRNATSFEVLMNNVSIVNSTGIFNEDSSYTIAVNGETAYTMDNLGNASFNYGDNEFKIIIKDTNTTSIKQFTTSSQDSFLKFYI
uniref:dolichyl-phosphate-mannose-protein mannosyltransferase n=1 Tax=Methanobrevibacter sp. TaxID=66852 RepID=UPI00386A3F11